MARHPLLWLSLLILLGGCAPKDPLDRKVKAGTPREFAHWWDRTREKFPDEQRGEIYKIARYLQDSTPRLKSMSPEDHYDPLCKQIDGMSVRELLVFGYRETNRHLRDRLILQTNRLASLANALAEATEENVRLHAERSLKYANDIIAQLDNEIAGNERRIAELEAAPSRPL
jgi:hypothetical protein